MQKKIELTVREGEVAGLMMKGMTRPEIASILSISPETVKKHLENILIRCEASNQKEALSVLYLDSFLYGENGMSSGFYVVWRKVHIVLREDDSTSLMTATSEQMCVKEHIDIKRGDIFADGEVQGIWVDGTKVIPKRKERGRYYYECAQDPPFRFGDVFGREVKSELLNSFSFPQDYLFIEQPLPCGQLILEVQLEGDRWQFESVEFEATLGIHEYRPVSEQKKVTPKVSTWIIDAPTALTVFTMRWMLSRNFT